MFLCALCLLLWRPAAASKGSSPLQALVSAFDRFCQALTGVIVCEIQKAAAGEAFPGQNPSEVHVTLHDRFVFGLSNGIWHNVMEQEAMAL